MKEKIYEIKLTESTSIQIEQQQGIFMSKVFELAHESGLIGHGIEITWLNASESKSLDMIAFDLAKESEITRLNVSDDDAGGE